MRYVFLRPGLLILSLAGILVAGAGCAERSEEPRGDAREAVGTTGDRAREVAEDAAEGASAAVSEARAEVAEAGITAKIKSKMALDDSLKAREISVETEGTTVTLAGTVETDAQRDRALQLARETDGVSQVVDHLRVRR